MGSRSEQNKAYISGFLDGDGSLMLQVKKRTDTKRGVRFMATICFYQDTRHEKPLHWICNQLGIGYISRRSDGISEYRINGFSQVESILIQLEPYIRFKLKQTRALIRACSLLKEKSIDRLSQRELRQLVDIILSSRMKTTKVIAPLHVKSFVNV